MGAYPAPEIRQGFDAALQTLCPDIGLDPGKDVAWFNAAFTPDTKRLYLRPACLFSDTSAASLGEDGFERISGIYQISILEVQGMSLGRAESMAREMVERFRGGTVLSFCGHNVTITTAYYGTPLFEGDRMHLPVSVVWRCYARK